VHLLLRHRLFAGHVSTWLLSENHDVDVKEHADGGKLEGFRCFYGPKYDQGQVRSRVHGAIGLSLDSLGKDTQFKFESSMQVDKMDCMNRKVGRKSLRQMSGRG